LKAASIEFVDVTKRYGDVDAVRGLTLTMAAGTLTTLLGPSGCGKTTTLRLIAGLELPTAGVIRIGGRDVSNVPASDRDVSMVFQSYALFPHMSVLENVRYGLDVAGVARQDATARARDALASVGLRGFDARLPAELSGGQQQRVALARALAPRPQLLLLDEPFSNLDVDLRERLSAEVRSILKQQNTTALLVTHDQHEAFSFADEIGIMHVGGIQQWASAYDLYHRPGTRLVADFIGQGVFLPGRVQDATHIRCELGILTALQPLGFAAGDTVEVLVRPDDVLHDDASPARAEVLHKTFRGAEFLYTLRLPGGSRVLSLVPSHHNHAIGERIGIRLEIDHLVAFAGTDEGKPHAGNAALPPHAPFEALQPEPPIAACACRSVATVPDAPGQAADEGVRGQAPDADIRERAAEK
jgi:iron(III) transport system ATP-binding protein